MDFEKLESLNTEEIKELYQDIIVEDNISYCYGGNKIHEDDFGDFDRGGSGGCELKLYDYNACTTMVFSKMGYYYVNGFDSNCWCYRYNSIKTWYTCE